MYTSQKVFLVLLCEEDGEHFLASTVFVLCKFLKIWERIWLKNPVGLCGNIVFKAIKLAPLNTESESTGVMSCYKVHWHMTCISLYKTLDLVQSFQLWRVLYYNLGFMRCSQLLPTTMWVTHSTHLSHTSHWSLNIFKTLKGLIVDWKFDKTSRLSFSGWFRSIFRGSSC